MCTVTQVNTVEQVLKLVTSKQSVPPESYEDALEQLEAYECWDYWFELVKGHAKATPASFVDDHCRLARVQIRYFEDVDAASNSCKAIVESSGMNFAEFRTSVLDRVVEIEDFAAEGVILRSAWERFSAIEDRVAALERICFIYEKKNHNEHLLNQFYERLLKIHPENAKALRYFRTLHTQLQEWPSVIDILKKLFNSAKHPQERFRYAQEMAAVYLYQLDDAAEAVRVIEEDCKNSTLDTSTIHYEAYLRLGKHDGCLKVLRACLLNMDDDLVRSVIHYRIASLYEQQENYPLAFENYEKALGLNDKFIEAIEGLISSCLKMRNWTAVKEWLAVLATRVGSASLGSQVRAGLARLEEGLKNAVLS